MINFVGNRFIRYVKLWVIYLVYVKKVLICMYNNFILYDILSNRVFLFCKMCESKCNIY